jgi:hypothetical protein
MDGLQNNNRVDIEAIWSLVVTNSPIPPVNTPLLVNQDDFPSADKVIGLDQFVKFWCVIQQPSVLSVSQTTNFEIVLVFHHTHSVTVNY